jgi:hypothetical protein
MIALLALITVGVVQAYAAEADTPADVAAALVTPSNGVTQGDHLTGDDATVFIAAYDMIPPVSHTDADEVVMFQHGDAPIVLVAFFRGGHLVLLKRVPADAYPLLKAGRVLGGGA